MTNPTTLYTKKADLILTSSSGRRTYKNNSTLYFSLTRDYTLSEIENEIRAQRDKILEKLKKIYEGKVIMTSKEDPVEKTNVNKIEGNLVYHDSGITPIWAIIEI